ncbi:internal scaffolding protein [Microviridae sp.]|nr:internal scaffolding protein [Microviridae sp.]
MYKKHKRVQLFFLDEDGNQAVGRTKQSMKEECDVNKLLVKHGIEHLLIAGREAKAFYGDFTEVNEFQESLNFVKEAERQFSELPSDIRKKFNNNAGDFFEFVTNPENSEELYDLGLAVRPDTKPSEGDTKPSEGDTKPSEGDKETAKSGQS